MLGDSTSFTNFKADFSPTREHQNFAPGHDAAKWIGLSSSTSELPRSAVCEARHSNFGRTAPGQVPYQDPCLFVSCTSKATTACCSSKTTVVSCTINTRI